MRLFKKKTDYSYYSSYNTKKRLRVDRVAIAVIAGIVVVVGLVAFLNLNRIKMLMKGYSWGETSEIISSFDKDEENEILSHDKIDHILKWVDHSNHVKLYDDYEKYWTYHKKMKYADIVETVDTIFVTQQPQLDSMGYSEKTIWGLIKKGSDIDDFQYLIDQKLTANQTKPYRDVSGCQIQKLAAYIEKYQEVNDYNYAVNIVNYPFIISSQENTNTKYIIQNPKDISVLVKKGFYLPEDYEPDDLVQPDVPIADDCENGMLRKEAAEALEEMFDAAEKDGLNLVLNSGYRSYAKQKETYDDYFSRYDPITAASLVAIPGASEHQTGLGVDLTCQAVQDDKKRGVNSRFGDKPDYKWCVANAYKYGFVLRFEDGKDDITGIGNEPWHFRYVGKDAAKEIFLNGWTYEEYCLYKNVIPKLAKE